METLASTIKAEARRIVDQLPDSASWEDLIYRLYVRQSIEAGIRTPTRVEWSRWKTCVAPFGLPE